ncbi:hypothetical protein [Acinetobacter bereziniae]|uniref:hypothetical protein n=1 Tax=Acinetobacter bereziniae TaxID=106648 RepID=UPI002259474B|nr:hypothetical protein [Acinetobacter bereziniae]
MPPSQPGHNLAGILGPMIAVRFMLSTIGIPCRADRPAETAVRTDPHAGRPVIGPLVTALRVVSIALWAWPPKTVVMAIAASWRCWPAPRTDLSHLDAVKAYMLRDWEETRRA